MRIFLMGYMGSGKSTFGQKLASALNMPFVDLDRVIEAQEEILIPAIFKKGGEAGFRTAEAKALSNVIKETSVGVISLGGGTPCHGNNLDLILASGKAIYLELSEQHLTARLSQRIESRPMLLDAIEEGADLQTHITEMLNARRPYYEQAHLTLDASNLKGQGFQQAVEKSRKLMDTA